MMPCRSVTNDHSLESRDLFHITGLIWYLSSRNVMEAFGRQKETVLELRFLQLRFAKVDDWKYKHAILVNTEWFILLGVLPKFER